ncbi:ABC transporter permease [Cytobacillus sp. FJAT-54145]|uniref:ABC transporter permease n=1 Tax=Cytobacillus spartinae TaxID=3299023 RepID=A0ABW6KJF9_9BACI
MNSTRLFMNRLIDEWKFQYKIIRSVADWTIILYIIIPSLAIFSFVYRSWWIESPVWIEAIPLHLLLFIGCLLALAGQYRTFVKEADKVFLIKNNRLFLNMKREGFIYSIVVQSLNTILITTLLLPFLIRHFSLEPILVVQYFIYLLAIKMLSMYIKARVRRIGRKDLRYLTGFICLILFGVLSYTMLFFWEAGFGLVCSMISILISVISILLHIPTIKKIDSFEYELAIEKEEKLKYVHVIYQFSYEIEKTNVSTRTKPFLNKRSKRIFKKRTAANGFIELFIKVFIRNHSYWLAYLQIIFVTATALIVVPPIWIKIIILVGFLIVLYSWLGLLWKKITVSHPLMKKYEEEEGYFKAMSFCMNSLFSVAFILTTIIFVVGLLVTERLPF